eukprot:6187018-Pleurochrysis_carterae.AAC.1
MVVRHPYIARHTGSSARKVKGQTRARLPSREQGPLHAFAPQSPPPLPDECLQLVAHPCARTLQPRAMPPVWPSV